MPSKAGAIVDPHALRPLLLAVLVIACGCQNGPFSRLAGGGAGKSPGLLGDGGVLQPVGGLETPPSELTSRAGDAVVAQYERLNADLTSQLADARKSAALLTERVTMLQEELNKTAIQFRDLQLAKLESDKRLQALAASTRSRVGATISTNNSVRGTLRPIEIPGADVRQEGDVIRISVPADQLFSPGTAQLLPNSANVLQEIARSVTQAYPRQLMSVEAFADSGVSGQIVSPHQLTVSQAYAVFQELTTRYRMPAGQMIVVGHGANVPKNSDSFSERARGRRIELVVYPETAQ